MIDTTTTDTDTDAPLSITHDAPDDVDDEAAKILTVYYGVIWTLEAINHSLEENSPPEDLTQEYIDMLETAFQTGQRLMEHHAYEAFLAKGPSALPEDLRDEISANLAPVASPYGVELNAGDDQEDLTLDDMVTADLNWRGS